MSYSPQTKRAGFAAYQYDASKPVDTFWDLEYFDNVGLSLSALSFGSSTLFRGSNKAFSITYASFNPAPMFTALIAYPGTAVRPLYRRGGVFATR